ncbi:Hypothetical protein G436_4180 [Leptospira interrogans serovar Hardjo str. Norma]|uniref:Uncharacterized protein n=1 Tax=Leptospira interrogans serovar Hardjo str. Norma TaxID=1279460 RepID=A0A0M4P1Y6_LEPIR|nr:Hypothetical protein G436_4180 [Leptospira interrogans serovar Hardjo str. Norma]
MSSTERAFYGSPFWAQNVHFSSVPTRMSLFTCKKYVFLIKKTFPPPPHPK